MIFSLTNLSLDKRLNGMRIDTFFNSFYSPSVTTDYIPLDFGISAGSKYYSEESGCCRLRVLCELLEAFEISALFFRVLFYKGFATSTY